MLVCGGINGVLAASMYSKKASEKFDYPTSVFSRGVVNALAGDVVVTVFVMVMVTMFLKAMQKVDECSLYLYKISLDLSVDECEPGPHFDPHSHFASAGGLAIRSGLD